MKIIKCKSATDLLVTLRRTHGIWRADGARPAAWVFRGQSSSTWDLVPSALRVGTTLGFSSDRIFESQGRPTDQPQMNAEFHAVYQFLEMADRVGLEVAGDSQVFRAMSVLQDVVGHSIGTREWPPHQILETLALAQHHGVPTRLLDFTEEPLIAAYFAVRNIWDRQAPEVRDADHFSVWAVNTAGLARNASLGTERIRIVHVPRSKNRFLMAQRGLFLYDAIPSETDGASLAAALSNSIAGTDSTVVLRLDAPRQWAPHVEELLDIEGINEASLMPSFGNVMNYLRHRRTREFEADSRCISAAIMQEAIRRGVANHAETWDDDND